MAKNSTITFGGDPTPTVLPNQALYTDDLSARHFHSCQAVASNEQSRHCLVTMEHPIEPILAVNPLPRWYHPFFVEPGAVAGRREMRRHSPGSAAEDRLRERAHTPKCPS
jgi:hypothetical protein